jgi:hypothetical protein
MEHIGIVTYVSLTTLGEAASFAKNVGNILPTLQKSQIMQFIYSLIKNMSVNQGWFKVLLGTV